VLIQSVRLEIRDTKKYLAIGEPRLEDIISEIFEDKK